jgi:molybdenum cofactor biosynthesis enzyme MoaA
VTDLLKNTAKKVLRAVGVENPHEFYRFNVKHKLLGKPYQWSDFPSTLQIDISNYCGFKYCGILCEYCKPQHDVITGRKKYGEMPMEQIEWICKNIQQHGRTLRLCDIFLNGDGLTDLRTPEILKLVKHYAPWAATKTFTNGVLTQNAQMLCDRNLDQIAVTLSAHNPEVYKKVYKRDHFKDVLSTIDYITEHHETNQALELHYVITQNNFPYIRDWWTLMKSRYPMWRRILSPLTKSCDNLPSDRALGNLTLEQQEETIRHIDSENAMWDHTTTSLHQPCVLWHNASIEWDGTILQCCNWCDSTLWNYGNVADYMKDGRTLRDYWMERLANKQRNLLCRACNMRHPDYKRRLDNIEFKTKITAD